MNLHPLDWAIIIGFLLLFLLIGLYTSRRAGKDAGEFFLSGRNMPWWLLGISMVATTFSADTPGLVTDLVRTHGVAGNWLWWCLLLTGLLTVFFYAKLWRRSGVFTDLEFYELRYSGKPAAFLRGFRAVYLGFVFNVIILATVIRAGVKISGVLMGIDPMWTIIIASIVTLTYSVSGGLRSIVLTDLIQFILAMVGTVWAAIFILNMPEIGGLDGLISHENVVSKLEIIPPAGSEAFVGLLLIPFLIQWWSIWYPGAEPGGGGYVAQRMLAARNESQAASATFLFNILHYAVRPWPWILIALASLVIFPDLEVLSERFEYIDPGIIAGDIAYPAMLTFLPAGLLGLVILSLIAAFMSTLSTHLNWGSSYLAYDLYKRFYNPGATERQVVWIGRIGSILLLVCAGIFSFALESVLDGFLILLKIGAGTGLIYILRWFWWRINAWSEISGMIISFIVALYFHFFHVMWFASVGDSLQILLNVGITTIVWLIITFLTRPTNIETLKNFYLKVSPSVTGWKPILHTIEEPPSVQINFTRSLLLMISGAVAVYAVLLGTGYALYGLYPEATLSFAISLGGIIFLIKNRKDFF